MLELNEYLFLFSLHLVLFIKKLKKKLNVKLKIILKIDKAFKFYYAMIWLQKSINNGFELFLFVILLRNIIFFLLFFLSLFKVLIFLI